MRTIKFRGWHKRSKKMYDIGYLYFAPNGELYGLLADETTQWGNMLATDDFELMQYTGWHDHNGKEVYEGDVIQFPSLHVGVVVWDTPNDGWRICVHQTMLLRDDEMNVVGNIYENPSIIKDDLEWRRRSYNEVVNN